MCSIVLKKKILGVLADNILGNASPELVTSRAIACRLNISLAETRSTLISMNEAGIIESDPETERALITRQGLCWLESEDRNRKTETRNFAPKAPL